MSERSALKVGDQPYEKALQSFSKEIFAFEKGTEKTEWGKNQNYIVLERIDNLWKAATLPYSLAI